MKNFLLLHFVTAFTFCNSQQATTDKTKTEPSTKFENSVYEVDNTDKEMLTAIKKAKSTFSQFENALESKNENYKNFTLKKAFQSPNGEEQLWIMYIMKIPNSKKFVGIVGNEPMYTKEVKFDDTVEIEPEEVTDWMYFDHSIVKGAYTLHVLRDRMSAEEKKAFDAESGFVFE